MNARNSRSEISARFNMAFLALVIRSAFLRQILAPARHRAASSRSSFTRSWYTISSSGVRGAVGAAGLGGASGSSGKGS